MVIKNTYIKRPIGVLIYDIDGTIMHHNTLQAHYFDVFKELGIAESEENFNEIINYVAKYLKRASLGEDFYLEDFINLIDKDLSFLRNSPMATGLDIIERGMELESKHLLINPGMDVLIRYMCGCGTNQAIFSNWFLEVQLKKLNIFGLAQYFNNIYTPEWIPAKPNINGFRLILELENVDPENAIMIGDSIEDMAAQEVGIQTILFDPKGFKKHLYDIAGTVVTSPDDIKRLLYK